MTAKELKEKFINYFIDRDHKEIANSSLIPENDSSVLFTNAGMHPLIPYLLGEKHPMGKRLVNVQRCLRTGDIDEVGDDFHLTCFEMLGNWSLGDYFKEDAIKMSYDFLINHLNLDPNRLYVTVFNGEDKIPKDEDTVKIWNEVGIPNERIFYGDRNTNLWGPIGNIGPCGPDTEMFYDTLKEKCSDNCSPLCNCGKYVEIWNDVFMQYNKLEDGSYIPLEQKNVDTGMGLERALTVFNGLESVYDTELFTNIIKKIEALSYKKYEDHKRVFRIISDHIRSVVFLLGDEKIIKPSNTDQGYILRRLIRRICRYLKPLEINDNVLKVLGEVVIDDYSDAYPLFLEKKEYILNELEKEEIGFNKTLNRGLKEFSKVVSNALKVLDGNTAFKLYDTYGFPIEMTIELCKEKGIEVDIKGFNERFKQHQALSRVSAEQKFKGGLIDNSTEVVNLHTATHLLHAALRQILGNTIYQKGSNITPERLRFDFSFDRKLTDEEIQKVENLVNDIINQRIDIISEEKAYEDIEDENIIGLFGDRYGEKVKIYHIGDFSHEICGGPHAKNTGDLGHFKIIKEESSSAGVRRIKAILE